MNTNYFGRANVGGDMAGGLASALASRRRPGSMLLAALLSRMAGPSPQEEISDLARRLRLYNEQLQADANEEKARRRPVDNAYTDASRAHNLTLWPTVEAKAKEDLQHAQAMNPLAVAKAQADVRMLPGQETQSANKTVQSNLETRGALAFAVPVVDASGKPVLDSQGNQMMRAMTPLEVEASKNKQSTEFESAKKAEQMRLMQAGKNWDADTLPAGATDNLDAWESWMKSHGFDYTNAEAASYSPRAADKLAREAAGKHLAFLSDLQNRMIQQDATQGSVNLNFPVGSDGTIPGQPKMSEATKRQVMAIEARKNELHNRLAKPALFGEADEPLYTLRKEEFDALVNPPPPAPAAVVAPGAPAVVPVLPAPMGMDQISGAFRGVRADNPYAAGDITPPAVNIPAAPAAAAAPTVNPAGRTLGEMLGIKLDAGGNGPKTVDPVRIFEAVGRDAGKARQVGDLLKGLGFAIPGY